MTETNAPTAAAAAPVPSPERIAFVTEVLRTGLAHFTEYVASTAPGGPSAPTMSEEEAKAAYDRASSNERRRMFRTTLAAHHGSIEFLRTLLDAGVTTLDMAITYLTPAGDPEPEAGQPANDAAAAVGAE